MNLKKCFSLLLLIFNIHYSFTMERENKTKHIVFDMGFLVQPNLPTIGVKLGFSGILQSLYTGNIDQQSTLRELFEVIKQIDLESHETEQEKNAETVLWQNEKVPPAMIQWLKNEVTCQQMLDLLKAKIAQQYYWTSSRIISIAEMAFDPETCSEVLSPYPATFDLIARLQKEGHTVHILGNFHKEIRSKLVSTYSEYFSHINGKIIVSGDIEEVKCQEHTKIYEGFLKRLPESNQNKKILFIESEISEKQMNFLQSQPSVEAMKVDPAIPVLIKQLQTKGLLLEK